MQTPTPPPPSTPDPVPGSPPPPAAQVDTSATGLQGVTTGQWLSLIAAVGLIVGALLPWAVLRAPFLGQISMAGIEGDGMFTAVIGIVVALVGFKGAKPGSGIWILVFAGIAVLILANAYTNVSDIGTDDLVDTGVGAGMYLSFLGAGAGMLSGLVRRNEAADAQGP